MPVGAAAASLVIAFAMLGVHPAALAVAIAAWVLAWKPASGIVRVMLLTLAPVALAFATPVDASAAGDAALAFAMTGLALVPLTRTLGPGAPPARAWITLAAVLLFPLILTLTPPGAVLSSSDLRTGAAIVALAAGLLVATSVAEASG